MNQITRNYILLNIPYTDKTQYTLKSKELLEVLDKNGIDISNVLILPDNVKVQCLELPIKSNNVE